MTKAIPMQPNSRVLVHGAAGGVGLAALQQVQALQAVPIATAGSPSKRRLLRDRGVQLAASSRDLSFVSDLAIFGGVQEVLNSLTSPGMVAGSLAGLGVGGAWVEIGKRDIWNPARLAQERPDVHYTLLALDYLPKQAMQSCMLELSAALSAGKLKPLALSVHSMHSTQAAMRQMVQAKHVGKVVVAAASDSAPFTDSSSTGSIAITGGTGALGSTVAAWLTQQQQQQHIQILARTGRATTNVVSLLQSTSTAEITVSQCNASATADVSFLKHQCQAGLTAVFHAGGVLADATLARQTPAHCRTVFAPKVDAMQKLQHITGVQPLQSFVAFSSMAGLLGSPGQANYSAANAVLDAATARLQLQGLSAVSMQYGAWQGGGMAGSTAHKQQEMGVGALTPDQGLRALHSVLAAAHNNSPHVIANTAAAPFNWAIFLKRLKKPAPLFAEFASITAKLQEALDSSAPTPAPEPGHRGTASMQLVSVQALQAEISAAVLDILSSAVSPAQPLMAAGLDSLSTVELTSTLQTRLGMKLPSTLVFDYPTISAIAEYAASQLQALPSHAANSTALVPSTADVSPPRTLPVPIPPSAAVAITAISARLPAPLMTGTGAFPADCSRLVPGDRWSPDLQLTPDMPARFGMFLERPYLFDAKAFACSQSEATLLDPQQRLLLECTHEVAQQHQVVDFIHDYIHGKVDG